MAALTIALLQLLPGPTADTTLERGLAACRQAKARGADIALFPELWNTGYTIPQDPAALRALALPADGDFAGAFARLAAELDMAIGVTLLEQYVPAPRNTLLLFDRRGRLALTYAKVHTCDFGDERVLTRGESFPVAALDSAAGPAQLRARAFENMTAIATCNYPAGRPGCNGHSTLFDGVAYLPDLEGSRDFCLLETGEGPGVYLARLDLDQLRAYRAGEVHGNAYRRPELYGALTDAVIRPPFVRDDRRP